MSESRLRKAFRTTKIKITKDTVTSAEQRDQLEALFMNLEAAKTDAVTAERHSLIAKAKTQTMQARAQIAEMEFYQAASSNFNQVAGERFWIVYRNSEGNITLEGFSERLIRNNLRAQQDMLGSQLENSGENVNRDGLYEEIDEDVDPDPNSN